MSISLILEGGGTRGAYWHKIIFSVRQFTAYLPERAMPFPIYQSRIKEIMRFLLNMPVTSVI